MDTLPLEIITLFPIQYNVQISQLLINKNIADQLQKVRKIIDYIMEIEDNYMKNYFDAYGLPSFDDVFTKVHRLIVQEERINNIPIFCKIIYKHPLFNFQKDTYPPNEKDYVTFTRLITHPHTIIIPINYGKSEYYIDIYSYDNVLYIYKSRYYVIYKKASNQYEILERIFYDLTNATYSTSNSFDKTTYFIDGSYNYKKLIEDFS